MLNPRTLLLAALGAILGSAHAAPAAPAAAGITVSGAWMRVITPQVPAGGYFSLHNGSNVPLTLTGASSPGCGMLMMHHTSDSNGMSSMDMVPSIPVPPGATVAFAPGGYHLMCMQPAPTMRPGGRIPVTLDFAGGRTLDTSFAVRNASGR